MYKVPYVIIGAGPTGLGAAYHFSKLGINDWLLLESSNVFGGLATSFKDDKGFIWDIGGHVQFSHYEYFDNAMIEEILIAIWENKPAKKNLIAVV